MTTLFPPLISLIGSSSPTPEDVRFEGVGLKLGGQQILRGINLALKRRETVAIVGESGCGKTTVLKLLIGLLTPTQGRVVFRGKSIATMDAREQSFLRRHFGFLFQAAALFDSMSVADNIAFGLRAQGILPEKDIHPIIVKMLSDVGLAPGVADKFPAELSGGMRKRVGLARALALNPEFMLFDEPTTGLDPIMTDMINDLILKVRSDLGITAILVTHEMRTVRKVADRVIMLGALAHLDPKDSQILFDGTVDEFMAHPDPRVQRFIQGDAQGQGENAFSSEPDSTLRWIDPLSIAPLVDGGQSQSVPLPKALPPSEIDVEATTFEVAPEPIRSIPGRMAVTLGSRAKRLPWEQGEEFLKPEPPPPPEPRILSDKEIQAVCVDVAPLAMGQIPGRTLVMLAAKPRQMQWELGEEFLKKEPEPERALVRAPGLLQEIDVEAKALDVAPAGVEQAPGQSQMVVVPPALESEWEMGEEFLKAPPEPAPELISEPVEEAESPFVYLHSSFEDKIFRTDEPLDSEAGLDDEPGDGKFEAKEVGVVETQSGEESPIEDAPQSAEESATDEEPEDGDEEFEEEDPESGEESESDEELEDGDEEFEEEDPESGEESESDEELEDEDEEFDEDGEIDLNEPGDEEGEDFGDPPPISREPLTDSMVLEEPLPPSEVIDPFEPYAETGPQSNNESTLGNGDFRSGSPDPSGSPDNTNSPPATPGESLS